MHPTARLAALALALGASGCWTNACIQDPDDERYASCSEEEVSLYDAVANAGDDEYEDRGYEGPSCDDLRVGTTCKDEGFDYECDGAWYKVPCD